MISKHSVWVTIWTLAAFGSFFWMNSEITFWSCMILANIWAATDK